MSVLESGASPAVGAGGGEPAQSVYGLRFRCLSPLEVLAQSVANIAPSACMAAFIPAVYEKAGNGTWISFVIATVGLTLVAMNINQFSRVSASPGSLYSYVTMGLGSTAGVLCGWGLMAAYLGTALALGGAATSFSLQLFGSPGGTQWPYVAFAAVVLITWFVAFKDIRLSARLMLGLEFASVGLILLLAAVIFAKCGFQVHMPHLTMQGITPSGLFMGLVLAIFCYVGFESATTLGEEARNPLRTIPRAVIGSVVIVGLFYALMSFAEVGGFAAAGQTLDFNSEVLKVLPAHIGMSFLTPVLVAMALVSSLGCVLASLNAGSRVLFSMGRHGVFHESMGGAHLKNETPHVAVTVCAIVVVVLSVAMMIYGYTPVDLLTLGGTFATFGFLLAYILISLATPFYLKGHGRLTTFSVVIAVLAMVFMVVPVIGSFVAAQDPPVGLHLVPYIFAGYTLLGVVWLIVRRSRSRKMIDKIEKDLEEIGERYNVGKSMYAADKTVEQNR